MGVSQHPSGPPQPASSTSDPKDPIRTPGGDHVQGPERPLLGAEAGGPADGAGPCLDAGRNAMDPQRGRERGAVLHYDPGLSSRARLQGLWLLQPVVPGEDTGTGAAETAPPGQRFLRRSPGARKQRPPPSSPHSCAPQSPAVTTLAVAGCWPQRAT